MPKLKKDDLLRKQFVSEETKVDIDERTVTAVITTDSVDRDREVLLPKGADLEQFRKNPVVLWAHDYSGPPIGKAQWIKEGRKRITAKVEFAQTEQAEDVFQLFKGGFLNAFSVGFRPTKSHNPTPDEIKKRPDLADVFRVFDEWELLEFSVVPVPANADALATAVKSKALILSDETKTLMDIEDEPDVYQIEFDEVKTIPVELDIQPVPINVRPAIIKVDEADIEVTGCFSMKDEIQEFMALKKGRIN